MPFILLWIEFGARRKKGAKTVFAPKLNVQWIEIIINNEIFKQKNYIYLNEKTLQKRLNLTN